jgi:hypothetical protein
MGCERIFVASDHPLPLIEFDPDDSNFWVGEFDAAVGKRDEDADVRRLFTKPYVYYVGSHLGCGCGFGYCSWQTGDYSIWRKEKEQDGGGLSEEQYQEIWEEANRHRSEEERVKSKESYEEGRRSVQRLRDYLKAATETGPIELYVRWGYDPIEEPEHRETITPDYFGGTSFALHFIHESLLTVQKSTQS